MENTRIARMPLLPKIQKLAKGKTISRCRVLLTAEERQSKHDQQRQKKTPSPLRNYRVIESIFNSDNSNLKLIDFRLNECANEDFKMKKRIKYKIRVQSPFKILNTLQNNSDVPARAAKQVTEIACQKDFDN